MTRGDTNCVLRVSVKDNNANWFFDHAPSAVGPGSVNALTGYETLSPGTRLKNFVCSHDWATNSNT